MKLYIWRGYPGDPERKMIKKIYICNHCRKEVPSLKCKVIDPQRPNQDDNWIEKCRECDEEVEADV